MDGAFGHFIRVWVTGILIGLSPILCVAETFSHFPAGRTPYFIHFTSSDSGLSFNNINRISQDSFGFIWIATENGLNRFDGRTFEAFYKDVLGVPTDFITCLCPDQNGNLWIGTDNGLTFYDYSRDCFRPLNITSDKGSVIDSKVTHIVIDRKDRVWISANGRGLFCYNPTSGELKNYFYDENHPTLPTNIKTFLIDANDEFLISLYCMDLWHADSKLQSANPVDLHGWKDNDEIVSIVNGSDINSYYLAGWKNGLCEVNVASGMVKQLIPNPQKKRYLQLVEDDEKKLWLASTGGVYCYDLLSGEYSLLSSDIRDKFSIADDSATAVFVDSKSGIWIGTSSTGINYCADYHKKFAKYYTFDNGSLAGACVMDATFDKKDRLWFVSDKEGLLLLDTGEGCLKKYYSRDLPNSIFSVCCDGDGLWLGSWASIYYLDTRTGRVKPYSRGIGNYGNIDTKVHRIFRTSSGKILAGSTLGMMFFDEGQDFFKILEDFRDIYVTDVCETPSGELWVSTYANGIYRYNFKNRSISGHYGMNEQTPHARLPLDKIASLCLDSRGDLWAGSYGSGLLRYDRDNDCFYAIEGLEDDNSIIFSIIDDDGGRMWIGTDSGLLSFAPIEGDVVRYTVMEGLLDDMISGNSAERLPDGSMWFYSNNGIISFQPKDIHREKDASIVVRGLQVNGEAIRPSDTRKSILREHINETSNLKLSHLQNNFGFSVSLLGSGSPVNINCKYILEGYDSDWRILHGEKISYDSVPTGNYVLKFRSVNAASTEGDLHSPIQISVGRAFYTTWLACSSYVLITIIIIFLSIRWFSKKAIKREKNRQKEAMMKKDVELSKEKMTFISNIIHEIKTPITLIRTPLRNILANSALDADVREDLMVIDNSTSYMDKLIKEILEYIRVEEGGWVVDYREMDFIDKLDFTLFQFRDYAKTKNLRIEFIHELSSLRIRSDESALTKILYNLLDNAVKYAETFVTLSVAEEDGTAVVHFINDGSPIPPERRAEIFRPFVRYGDQSTPFSQSFGIGLPLAKTLVVMLGGDLCLVDGDMTDFMLVLPIGELPSAPPMQDTEQTSLEPIISKDKGQKPRVLIVEDNHDLAVYLARKLSLEYDTLTADSAEEGLKIIMQKDVNLVLSDIALGGASGADLCKAVSTDIESSHIPIIILSAISSPNVKIQCMENGAALYVEKPFDLDYLRHVIRLTIKKREYIRQVCLLGSEVAIGDFALTSGDSEFLIKLNNVISDNLSDPDFNIMKLANAMFVSVSTLTRKCKGLLGMPPNDYIRIRRLNVAASLLSERGRRVNEVCYSVGFNTPSYFTKCFKAQFGILPQEYRGEGKTPIPD